MNQEKIENLIENEIEQIQLSEKEKEEMFENINSGIQLGYIDEEQGQELLDNPDKYKEWIQKGEN